MVKHLLKDSCSSSTGNSQCGFFLSLDHSSKAGTETYPAFSLGRQTHIREPTQHLHWGRQTARCINTRSIFLERETDPETETKPMLSSLKHTKQLPCETDRQTQTQKHTKHLPWDRQAETETYQASSVRQTNGDGNTSSVFLRQTGRDGNAASIFLEVPDPLPDSVVRFDQLLRETSETNQRNQDRFYWSAPLVSRSSWSDLTTKSESRSGPSEADRQTKGQKHTKRFPEEDRDASLRGRQTQKQKHAKSSLRGRQTDEVTETHKVSFLRQTETETR